jgi:uncharacterized repeat protein (TIGR03803 family)
MKKASQFSAYLLCVAVMGCSQMTEPSRSQYIPTANAVSGTTSSGYQVLHSFGSVGSGSSGDGATPQSSLLNVKGVLYGTTTYGGFGEPECPFSSGCGTVYSVTTDGTERVLYRFGGQPDGYYPEASLIDVKGTLYGTTLSGGAYDFGTVFRVTTSGVEKVLYSFGNGSDGRYPKSSLLAVNGALYGTTLTGGTYKGGTVFRVSTTGAEKVLHSFGKRPDGGFPYAGLIDVGGKLYGTTYYGGGHNAGTVFSITLAGTESVLHSFSNRGGSDGYYPQAKLAELNGTLYGTTLNGGRHDCGTVFTVGSSGAEKVLYSFRGGGFDGADPEAGLLALAGTLYGTTANGQGGGGGDGTLFSVTTTGAESVLHTFKQGAAGAIPVAGVVDLGGTLYGTAAYDGTDNFGIAYALTLTARH